MECIAAKLYSTCVLYAESTLHLHAHQIPLQTHHLSHATTVRQTVAAWGGGGGVGVGDGYMWRIVICPQQHHHVIKLTISLLDSLTNRILIAHTFNGIFTIMESDRFEHHN